MSHRMQVSVGKFLAGFLPRSVSPSGTFSIYQSELLVRQGAHRMHGSQILVF